MAFIFLYNQGREIPSSCAGKKPQVFYGFYMNDFNLASTWSSLLPWLDRILWTRSAKETRKNQFFKPVFFFTAMAPVLSKLVGKSPSLLSSILGKPIAVTGGGLALVLWLLSVHRTNQNRRQNNLLKNIFMYKLIIVVCFPELQLQNVCNMLLMR